METLGLSMNNFYERKSVLVTGATGLVGGWLVKKLVENSADVVILVRDWIPSSNILQQENLGNVKIVRGCVEDQVLMERLLGEYETEIVFHLAAQTIVQIANRNPVSTFKSNIEGTWSLLEACRRSPKVKSIAIASSDKAYGEAEILPYNEQTPLNPIHPYDVSKACADLISRSYAHTYEMPVSITRCGNFYGGGDLNWSRIVPGTIRSLINKERPVLRSDGSLIRDYIFVEDAVHAYLTLAEQLYKSPDTIRGESFNFSTQDPISALDMVKTIMTLMPEGNNKDPIIEGQAPNEILAQSLDSTKAKNILKWQAQYNLSESLQKTIHWYRDHLTKN